MVPRNVNGGPSVKRACRDTPVSIEALRKSLAAARSQAAKAEETPRRRPLKKAGSR